MTTVQLEQNYTQLTLSPGEILADPNQPRVINLEADFTDLVASIAEQGILQPIQVAQLPDGQYRIIAGSRRLAAALQLGLPAIPCLVRTTPLSDYARLLSQLAENRVRADTDPYDEAIALKTAKVLADIQAATLHLATVEGLVVPTRPEAQTETNHERLERHAAYLEQLITLLTSPEVAPLLPKEIVYLDKASGEYRLSTQALTAWGQLEQACGLSKSKRISLVRLAQVKPEVVELVRKEGGATLSPWVLRQRLSALAGVAPDYQQAVVESLVAQGQSLVPELLERLAQALEQLELEGEATEIDLPRLVTLLLSTPDGSAIDLSQLKPGAGLEPTDDLDELMGLLADDQPNPTPSAARPNLSTDFTERSGGDEGGGKPGKNRGTPRPGRDDEGEDYGDEGGYGGGGGSGMPLDLDASEGFSLEGQETELPPELAAELEALGLSDSAKLSIASLDPADRPKLVEMLRQHPEMTGRLRSIVKLMREEGYSLEAAMREYQKPQEETNPDEQALQGVQKLVEATTLLKDALDALRECAPDGQLAHLDEPFTTRLQDSLLLIRQLLLEAGFEF